jgi:oligopeptide/dipeptide ABC transporter ATP-binding protein
VSAGTQWLSTIEGTVPAVGQMGPGCAFAPRCALARAACTSLPPLRTVGAGHQAACVAPFEAAVGA